MLRAQLCTQARNCAAQLCALLTNAVTAHPLAVRAALAHTGVAESGSEEEEEEEGEQQAYQKEEEVEECGARREMAEHRRHQEMFAEKKKRRKRLQPTDELEPKNERWRTIVDESCCCLWSKQKANWGTFP